MGYGTTPDVRSGVLVLHDDDSEDLGWNREDGRGGCAPTDQELLMKLEYAVRVCRGPAAPCRPVPGASGREGGTGGCERGRDLPR